MNRTERGFTLIEIAIVLVIIGLLLGGVLKGQELITGARVRNFIQQQDGVKAAYFGFLDRYRALPGDYTQALANIPNIGAVCTSAAGNGNGNGNGQIQFGAQPHENILVWEHLSKAGFINGSYTCNTTPSSATSPSNPYGSILDLRFDTDYQGSGGTANRHNLKTGDQVPSDILAEIDRKVDDGNPAQGSFRAPTAPAAGCTVAGPPMTWATNPVGANCAGTTLF
jgi:prepilin-type N-terminal cleavage/methylation domain-containing protein